MILLVVLGSVNMALSPKVPFEEGAYLELEKQFEKRTALLRSEEKRQMKQYFPSPQEQVAAMETDSLPADSVSRPQTDNPDKDAQKDRISINTADKKALQTLPGIGPTYAERIIIYRREHGGFETLEELKKIKGIAQKRLEKLKPFVKL